jgi:hypothetical protein
MLTDHRPLTTVLEARVMSGKAKPNLHRETLKAALRVIHTSETLDQARIQLGRMLNIFDKLEAQGTRGDAAVREAEKRMALCPPPKTSSADERPIRRRDPGRTDEV